MHGNNSLFTSRKIPMTSQKISERIAVFVTKISSIVLQRIGDSIRLIIIHFTKTLSVAYRFCVLWCWVSGHPMNTIIHNTSSLRNQNKKRQSTLLTQLKLNSNDIVYTWCKLAYSCCTWCKNRFPLLTPLWNFPNMCSFHITTLCQRCSAHDKILCCLKWSLKFRLIYDFQFSVMFWHYKFRISVWISFEVISKNINIFSVHSFPYVKKFTLNTSRNWILRSK